MTNNDIFKKLRVALMLRDDEIVEILKLADFNITKSELGALFRKEDHPNYMECGDQILRNFLNGLIIHLRGTKESPKNPGEVLSKGKIKAGINPTKRFDNKSRQKKKFNNDISSVKYKNKKKS
ncbi:MAG: DUF1456 family protein [Maribacter sp.]|nr:DUF1456 family protein [Maribacter sp.]